MNGANARCLSRITGQTAHQEVSRLTRTYDLVHAIRKRKFQWLGHILRLQPKLGADGQPILGADGRPCDRLVKHAVKVQFDRGMLYNLREDAPITSTFGELIILATDKKRWKERRDNLQ